MAISLVSTLVCANPSVPVSIVSGSIVPAEVAKWTVVLIPRPAASLTVAARNTWPALVPTPDIEVSVIVAATAAAPDAGAGAVGAV